MPSIHVHLHDSKPVRNPARDAFEEGKHPRGKGGQFASGTHSVATKHGWQKAAPDVYTHRKHPNHAISIVEKGSMAGAKNNLWIHETQGGEKNKRVASGSSITSLHHHLRQFHDSGTSEGARKAAETRKSHGVFQKTPGGGSKLVREHGTEGEATAHARRLNVGRTPHAQRNENTGYIVRPLRGSGTLKPATAEQATQHVAGTTRSPITNKVISQPGKGYSISKTELARYLALKAKQ